MRGAYTTTITKHFMAINKPRTKRAMRFRLQYVCHPAFLWDIQIQTGLDSSARHGGHWPSKSITMLSVILTAFVMSYRNLQFDEWDEWHLRLVQRCVFEWIYTYIYTCNRRLLVGRMFILVQLTGRMLSLVHHYIAGTVSCSSYRLSWWSQRVVA